MYVVWARRRSKASRVPLSSSAVGDALEVDDLAHEGAHEGVTGPERADDRRPDDKRDGGLLDGDPLRVELQQADAAREQDAYDTDDGEEIEFPAADEVVGAVAEREGQARPRGRQPGLACPRR